MQFEGPALRLVPKMPVRDKVPDGHWYIDSGKEDVKLRQEALSPPRRAKRCTGGRKPALAAFQNGYCNVMLSGKAIDRTVRR